MPAIQCVAFSVIDESPVFFGRAEFATSTLNTEVSRRIRLIDLDAFGCGKIKIWSDFRYISTQVRFCPLSALAVYHGVLPSEFGLQPKPRL